MKDITYNEWITPMRQKQIAVVALLTAVLYLISSVIDSYLISQEILPFANFFHLYTVPISLLIVSYLANQNKYPKLIIVFMMLAPVYASFGNIYLSYTGTTSIHFVEVSLIIFWVFTVSGLNLKESIVTTLIVAVMSVLYLYLFNPYNREDTAMLMFWMLASFSFGLVVAVLIDKYLKEIYRNFIELKTLSTTDILTGLYNRAFVDEAFKAKLLFTQKKVRVSIMMIDIDDFKKINDNNGHHIGDIALVKIASIIKKYTNEFNIAIRWGGEEFILIMIDTDEKKTAKLCESIRREIDETQFDIIDKATVSIGYSLYKYLDSFDFVLSRADNALYTAKNNGKNRVESL